MLIKIGSNHLWFKLWTHRARFEANKGNYSCIAVELERDSWKINCYFAQGSEHARSSAGIKGFDHQWETLWVSLENSWPWYFNDHVLSRLQPCQNPAYLILNSNKKTWSQFTLKSQINALGVKFLSKLKDRAERNVSAWALCSQFWSVWFIRVSLRCYQNVVT